MAKSFLPLIAWLTLQAVVHAEPPLTCLVHPYATITISTSVAGRLETVTVERGDVVKVGQIVANIYSSVESAHGAFAYAQAELSNEHLADLEWKQTVAEVALRTIRSPI